MGSKAPLSLSLTSHICHCLNIQSIDFSKAINFVCHSYNFNGFILMIDDSYSQLIFFSISFLSMLFYRCHTVGVCLHVFMLNFFLLCFYQFLIPLFPYRFFLTAFLCFLFCSFSLRRIFLKKEEFFFYYCLSVFLFNQNGKQL